MEAATNFGVAIHVVGYLNIYVHKQTQLIPMQKLVYISRTCFGLLDWPPLVGKISLVSFACALYDYLMTASQIGRYMS